MLYARRRRRALDPSRQQRENETERTPTGETVMPAKPRKPAAQVGFIRLESYGFKSSKGRRTIPGIVNEMTRRPSAIPHVFAPIAEMPLFCPFGPPSGVSGLIREKIAEFDSLSPKRTRKDAQLLVAGVASYPVESAEMLEDESLWNQFGVFCKLVVRFLLNEFGERLHSAVAHIADERFPHVHFMLLPYNVPENAGKLGIGANHPGKFADDRTGDRRAKYKAAMKAFLDRFHEAVGKAMGWARISGEPRQRNPNRKQYLWFRDLWETLTNVDDAKDDDEPVANAAPKRSTHFAQVGDQVIEIIIETPANKLDQETEMKLSGNQNETVVKPCETFHLPPKSTISPMKRRF
jgi:hypothetical protein